MFKRDPRRVVPLRMLADEIFMSVLQSIARYDMASKSLCAYACVFIYSYIYNYQVKD